MRAKRIVFGLMLAAFVYGLLELCAMTGLWILNGERLSLAQLREMEADRAELKLRALPTASANLAQGSRKHQVLHPYIGYVGDADKNHLRKERGIVPYNEFGFSEEDSPLQHRSPDKVIVAIVGGSVAYMFAESGTAALAAELKRNPRWADKEFVFLNFGLGGYKQPQQLLLINYFLALGAEFDWVINIDGFNEVALHGAENQRKGVFHAYPRSWWHRVQVLPNVTTRLLEGELSLLQTKQKRWAKKFARFGWQHSYVVHLVWWLRDRRFQVDCATTETRLREYEPPHNTFGQTGPPSPATEEAVMAELVAVWERCSRQLHRLCAANDARYFHFLQPNQYVEGSKPFGEEERKIAIDERHNYRPGALSGYPKLRETGAQLWSEGIAFFDLTPIFADTEEPLYIDSCCHFNELGNEIMGRAIADRIQAAVEDGG